MLVPIEEARWPGPGEVRDLRVSLNAPVLLGPDIGAATTRAALGWVPSPGEGARVRVWLRAEPADGEAVASIRAFDFAGESTGPAERANALEGAERFLSGLGFLLDEPAEPGAEGDAFDGVADGLLRTSVLDPVCETGGTASAVAATTVVRADVRSVPSVPNAPAHTADAFRGDIPLTKFRRRGVRRPDGEAAHVSSRGILEGLLESLGLRTGGTEA